MAKMKFSLCVILWLFCFSVAVFGSTDSDSDPPKNPVSDSDSDSSAIEHLEGLVKYFKSSEDKNREQEKVIEDLKEQMKSLSEKFDQLENRISSDHGVWFLTPPWKKPQGKRGKTPGQLEENENSAFAGLPILKNSALYFCSFFCRVCI